MSCTRTSTSQFDGTGQHADMTRLADCLKYLYRPKETMTAFTMKSPVARHSLCPTHTHTHVIHTALACGSRNKKLLWNIDNNTVQHNFHKISSVGHFEVLYVTDKLKKNKSNVNTR